MTGYINSYLITILTIGLIAFICDNICCVQGKAKALSGAVGLITSLCILITAIRPVFDIFNSIKNLSGLKKETVYEVDKDDSFISLVAQNLQKNLKSIIFEKTGIAVDDICIDLSVENDTIEIKNIVIYNGNTTDEQANIIEKTIKDNLQTQTDIIFTEL